MREIKFRGKVGRQKVWMYVTPESSSWEKFWALVDKETLGQYTGLKDKTPWEKATQEEQRRWLKHNARDDWKGREIYVGDVVKGAYDQYGDEIKQTKEVKYDEQMQLMPFHDMVGYDGELWMDEASYEITGNIHDIQEQQA